MRARPARDRGRASASRRSPRSCGATSSCRARDNSTRTRPPAWPPPRATRVRGTRRTARLQAARSARIHHRAEAQSHSEQKQRRLQKARKDRASPHAAIDERVALHNSRIAPHHSIKRPSGNAEKHILERRSPHDRALERDAERMHLLQRVLAVGRVDLHAIGQHLDPIADAVQPSVEARPHVIGKTQLEHFSRRILRDERRAAILRRRCVPCP